jgi:Flp pilus assembly protein protease CpaA
MPLSHVVLVSTPAVLFYVALTGFKEFKIRNEQPACSHALLSGRVSGHGKVTFAALMFCVMLYFYAQNLMGGGDVILTVGFLWIGFLCAFHLAARLAVFAAVHVVAGKLAPQSEPRSVETRSSARSWVGIFGNGALRARIVVSTSSILN